MGMSIKVKSVTPIGDLSLLVGFENGVSKKYDVSQLLADFPMYHCLKDPLLFQSVRVDCGGYAIAWDQDIDISECELWENGVLLEKITYKTGQKEFL